MKSSINDLDSYGENVMPITLPFIHKGPEVLVQLLVHLFCLSI